MQNDISYDNFYSYITAILSKSIELWKAGEGDIVVEVRDSDGKVKAKIKGGVTERIGK